METFKASVPHGDFKGSSAADWSDFHLPSSWLFEHGHISKDEYVLGVEMYHYGHDMVSVTFLTIEHDGSHGVLDTALHSNNPMELKRVSINMSLLEFFGLFKSFNVKLSKLGQLEGKPYTTYE